MTTTNVYQGMDESGKPTSRVLRPPGGGSSFTLGGGDDTPPRAPVAPLPAQPSPAGTATLFKPEQENVEAYRDRLFGGGQTTEVKKKAGGNPKNMGFNPITGIPHASPEDKDEKEEKNNNAGGTYDPITGKELQEPKEQKAPHTSTRVRQPPGGASSGLW